MAKTKMWKPTQNAQVCAIGSAVYSEDESSHPESNHCNRKKACPRGDFRNAIAYADRLPSRSSNARRLPARSLLRSWIFNLIGNATRNEQLWAASFIA
jgi:hypothetical protein